MNKRLDKNYIIFSIVISSLLFLMGISFIYIIDPAGVNNKFNLGLIKDSEISYRTQKFVELNKVKPNTILLGGSRVHFLDPSDIEKYTNDKVYNLGLSKSTLEEQYYFLKYSIENFKIKNVIIGLNLYPFSEILAEDLDSDFDKEIFESGFTLQKQLKYYLEIPLVKYAKDTYNKKWNEPLYINGSRNAYNQIKYIQNKTWQELEKSSIRTYVKKYETNLVWEKKGLNTFKDMVQLCKDNNINLKVFTTAIYVTQLQILKDINKIDIYYKWKKEVANITPYWDFMYPNIITKNSDNFIDTSHIRREKGYLYFVELFKDNNIESSSNFGRYITKDNVDEHLVYLKKEMENSNIN